MLDVAIRLARDRREPLGLFPGVSRVIGLRVVAEMLRLLEICNWLKAVRRQAAGS